MTREEQIIQASDKWTYQKPPQYSELVHKTHKVMCAYQVGFIDGAVWADENPCPRWISVEDELPSLYNDYLVCTSGNIIEISHFNIDGWHNESAGKVTHWMPLPKLPIVANLGKSGKKGGND